MSKAKAQGTALETWVVKRLQDIGIKARRVAEGGSLDEGDVEAHLNERWILECKSRQTLSVQTALGKARKKANGHPVALVWKRIVKSGKAVRTPVAGERIVVVLSWDDFVKLIEEKGK